MNENPDSLSAENEVSAPLLSPVEARVLGSLMEKRRTTPDNYPMTLNALVQACNQKSSRNPVMQLEPGEVGHTVNQLRDRNLVAASFSSRAERYEHKMVGHFHLDRAQEAVLCVLMLRGPQTAGELRTNGARLADFSALDTVNEALENLLRRDLPLAMKLPRSPGQREERYAHLLCGEPDLSAVEAAAPAPSGGNARIEALEQEVRRLRAQIEALWQATGLEAERPRDD